MNTIFVLLSPLWLSWKNDFRRAGNQWGRRLFLLGLALAFWCGTFFVIRRVLIYFQSVYELGPALAYQLLLIILLTFLSMLLFSNLVTSLSTFFFAACPREGSAIFYSLFVSLHLSGFIFCSVSLSLSGSFNRNPSATSFSSWPPWKLRRPRFCRAAGPLRSWPGAFSIGRSNKGSFTPYSPAMRYFSLSLLPGSLAPFTSLDGPRRKNRGRAGGKPNGSIGR